MYVCWTMFSWWNKINLYIRCEKAEAPVSNYLVGWTSFNVLGTQAVEWLVSLKYTPAQFVPILHCECTHCGQTGGNTVVCNFP